MGFGAPLRPGRVFGTATTVMASGTGQLVIAFARATYALEADPGRMLGLLLRGPAETAVRDFLLGNAADGLKEKAEAE